MVTAFDILNGYVFIIAVVAVVCIEYAKTRTHFGSNGLQRFIAKSPYHPFQATLRFMRLSHSMLFLLQVKHKSRINATGFFLLK